MQTNMFSIGEKIEKVQIYYFWLLAALLPFVAVIKTTDYFRPLLVLVVVYLIMRLVSVLFGHSKINIKLLPSLSIILAGAVVICLYQFFVYEDKHVFGFVKMFSLVFIFIFYFAFDQVVYEFSKNNLTRYVNYLFFVSSLWVISQYIMVHMFGMNIYDQFLCNKDFVGNCIRPPGLTGSPSVNAPIIIFFYIVAEYLGGNFPGKPYVKNSPNNHQSRGEVLCKILKISCMTAAVFLQGSGMGYLLYTFVIINLFFKKSREYGLAILFGIPVLLVFTYFNTEILAYLNNEVIFHLLPSYFDYIIAIMLDELVKYVDQLTFFKLLFGTSYPYYDAGFGYLFFLSCMGFPYVVTYFYFVGKLVRAAHNREFTFAILLLLFSDFHYAVMFFHPIIPFVLALLSIRLFMTDAEYKTSLISYFQCFWKR